MDKLRKELRQGTLDLFILKVISTASLHGWDIAKRIAIVSQDRLSLNYRALHWLKGRGWIDAKWGLPEAGRSAKFYRLTTTGGQQFGEEIALGIIRFALGARVSDITRLVLGSGVRLVRIGAALGTIGGIGLTRLIAWGFPTCTGTILGCWSLPSPLS